MRKVKGKQSVQDKIQYELRDMQVFTGVCAGVSRPADESRDLKLMFHGVCKSVSTCAGVLVFPCVCVTGRVVCD